MDLFEDEPKKRKLITLQLAPLIDIFVLIIVFLIKGTVFGGAATVVPNGLMTPKSSSKESLDVAPQVYIYQNQITFKMIGWSTTKKEFFDESTSKLKEDIKKEIKKYKENLPTAAKKDAFAMLNFIADASTPYDEIFSTVKFLRECGYESLLFIAEGDSK